MALQPRWLLLATLGAIITGIAVGIWLYQAIGGSSRARTNPAD